MNGNPVRDAILGVCVGDALGVPVEFSMREALRSNPVTGMRSYGVWNQPKGTWSDDSSLTLCLAESLCHGFDPEDIGQRFLRWYREGYWGAHYEVFDIGNATRTALERLGSGAVAAREAGLRDAGSNGNGSLMRIAPMAFVVRNLPRSERARLVAESSSITHGHARSVLACDLYIEYALLLLEGRQVRDAYEMWRVWARAELADHPEYTHFQPLIAGDIGSCEEAEIGSSGYVVDTLQASMWCLLTSRSFAEAVLKAVNLGGDTDTTAAVTGGLAGLAYGAAAIPLEWVMALARLNDIEKLCERLFAALERA
ncbi:ADP-ribosylglycohydrolase family protein [Paenibacillus athensensis]|nr:ADP-ribosylglycohydrolase family protein [Paenibacillus athensensis]